MSLAFCTRKRVNFNSFLMQNEMNLSSTKVRQIQNLKMGFYLFKRYNKFTQPNEQGVDLRIWTLNQDPVNRTMTTKIVEEFMMHQKNKYSHKSCCRILRSNWQKLASTGGGSCHEMQVDQQKEIMFSKDRRTLMRSHTRPLHARARVTWSGTKVMKVLRSVDDELSMIGERELRGVQQEQEEPSKISSFPHLIKSGNDNVESCFG